MTRARRVRASRGKTRAIAGLAVLLAAGLPKGSGASFIRLRIDATVHVTDGVPTAQVAVSNEGDEAAKRVSMVLDCGRESVTGDVHEAMEPGESVEDVLLPELPLDEPGQYHFPLRVRYHDANGYPFMAVAAVGAATLTVSEPPLVAGAIAPVALEEGAGRLRLTLRGLGGTPLDAEIQLILPDEIMCDTVVRRVTVFPGRRSRVDFAVSNATGRAGSTYGAVAVVSCRSEGLRRSLAVPASVAIGKAGLGRFAVPVLAGAAVVLLVLFAVLQLTGRREA